MPEGYDTHADYMDWVRDEAESRQTSIVEALRETFSRFIEVCEVEIINFSDVTAKDLATAIHSCPLILKPLLACCNIGGRAMERDLDLRNLNTYQPKITQEHSLLIAGYLKPFLPPHLAIPALGELDRHFFVDKQIRMLKGRWERAVREVMNARGSTKFKKRAFVVGNETFELDAASPVSGNFEIGIDVKRIEARRDIHKRCDEIVNKASKFKMAYPTARFGVVLYYPFTAEHINVQNRLESPNIDAVVFASQSNELLTTAIGLLLDRLQTEQ